MCECLQLSVEQEVNTVIKFKMYFDNFLKNNPNYPNLSFQPNYQLGYGAHSTLNNQYTPPSNKPYLNSKYGEYIPDNRVIPVRNHPETFNPSKNHSTTQPPYLPSYLNTSSNTHPQMNNTSFIQDIPNNIFPQQNNEFAKRRDSISNNNYYKPAQTHSPSAKSTFPQSNAPNQITRATFGNQTGKNYTNQHQGSSTQNLNTSTTIKNFQDNTQTLGNKLGKDLSQQKFLHKIGHYKHNNNDTSLILQQKTNPKCNTQHTSGYSTGNKRQNQQEIERKTKQSYWSKKQNGSIKNIDVNNNSESFYNFELKNIQADFGNKKSKKQSNQSKYYTPHLFKENSQKNEKFNPIKNDYSRISQAKQNQKQKIQILTDRQIYKSPSYTDLFQSVYNEKEGAKTKNYSYANLNTDLSQIPRKNSQISKNPLQTTISNNGSKNITPQSLSNINSLNYDPIQKNPASSNKNYHALIENIEKKLSQQKKWSQNFQTKQKFYLNQIGKKQERIKCLENIIDNNKQIVITKDEIIRQLRGKIQSQATSSPSLFKKQQLSNTADSAQLKDLQIQQLKRQNQKYKQEIKKLKRKLNQTNENSNLLHTEKQFSSPNWIQQKQKLGQRIKQLQKQLSEMKQQKESYAFQISKLRESNSNLHQQYNLEIKEHQKVKQENGTLKKTKEALQQNLRHLKQSATQIQSKYNSSKEQAKKLRQKYQTLISNEKASLNIQYEGKLERDIKKLKENFQLQKQQHSKTMKQEAERLKIKLQRFEAEVNFKNAKIKDLQQKLNKATHPQHPINQNTSLKSQMNEMYLQQLSLLREKLKRKEDANETFVEQLKNKTQIFQRMTFQKELLECKIEKLESKLKSLKQVQEAESKKVEEEKDETNEKIGTNQEEDFQRNVINQNSKQELQQTKKILQCYHKSYKQLAILFNFSERQKEKQKIPQQGISLTSIPFEDMEQNQSQGLQASKCLPPSRQYLQAIHPLIKEQIQKILKDIKKLVSVLKENQAQVQQKNQKLYEMDKTIKKQINKINSMLGEIHMKNITIVEINKMQIEKDICRLNQKYEILMNVNCSHELE